MDTISLLYYKYTYYRTPSLQTFEIEVIWMLYQYWYLKNTQYSLLTDMLEHISTTFNITHTFFSSPLTCSTLLNYFYSPFSCNWIFGSLGTTFCHKWNGFGFSYPPPSLLPQAIHMARFSTKEDPLSYTIIVNSYPNWHQYTNPYYTAYPNTHVIAYILPNTL
jgi:hypothetical protein